MSYIRKHQFSSAHTLNTGMCVCVCVCKREGGREGQGRMEGMKLRIPAAAQEIFYGSKCPFLGLKLAMPSHHRSSLVWSYGPMQDNVKHETGILCVAESSLVSLPH